MARSNTKRRTNRGRPGWGPVALSHQLLRSRWGRVGLILLTVALAAWYAYDSRFAPRRPDGDAIRVATWNLRQFSAEREEIDFDAIAERIERWGFDVLAIQEVKGDGEAVPLLVDALNDGLLGGPWRFETGPPTGNAQRFAFVYDSTATRFEGFVSLPNESLLRIDRTPLAGRFKSGEFDFTLVSVHLFASDVERRRGESAQLALALLDKTLPAGEGDVIILGDFNSTTKRESVGSLAPLLAAGWDALNETPTNLGGTAVLDNIVISPSATREWTGRVGVESLDMDADKARRTVSDHLPVWADFAVGGPDDD